MMIAMTMKAMTTMMMMIIMIIVLIVIKIMVMGDHGSAEDDHDRSDDEE